MSKLIQKIEEAFEHVSSNFQFESKSSVDEAILDDSKRLTFPEILDYSFPTEADGSKIKQVGEVIYVGDGVVHVRGLDKATVEEIISIHTQHGLIEKALILGIQEEKVEAVVMGDFAKIKRGDQATTTGSKMTVPVGKALRGRVVNPLGLAIDGKGPIKTSQHRDVEFAAPGVMDRKPIYEPMHTGIMVIDTTIPVGRGQRELVVGDRKTGKSRTMLDIISNQKGKDVLCVYVGIGIQAAKAKATLQLLEARGAMEYTVMVCALADDPPTLQYMSPYVGVAIAEEHMYKGGHALIVYDDLSKQAKAYRQVSLLLKRSPGRDAYPGDIFFLHSRLLERAAKVSDDLGAGSITALPIAETQAGDLSDYIITNLMSITDGHIYLDANMMNEGVLPAVNSGASVSRIGGKVQTPLLRKVGELAGRILARYNEVKSFETINTEVADETIRDIKRGKRVREVFSQRSALNLTPDEEIVVMAIATSARMDELELHQVEVYKKQFPEYYREQREDGFAKLCNSAKKLEEIDSELDKIYAGFCKKFDLPYTQV